MERHGYGCSNEAALVEIQRPDGNCDIVEGHHAESRYLNESMG
jgi:hypothetical protein